MRKSLLLTLCVALCLSCTEKPEPLSAPSVPENVVEDEDPTPRPVLEKSVREWPTAEELSYRFVNLQTDQLQSWGLCWSDDHLPTVEDGNLHGPIPSDGKKGIHQLIPNVAFKPDIIYKVRAYAETESGFVYSREFVEVGMPDNAKPIVLGWKRQNVAGLPESIELYSCDTRLFTRRFKAWYAVADVTGGDIELRVQIPEHATTVREQAGEGCHVLVNGAYFSSDSNYGFACVKGVRSGHISPVAGSNIPGDAESLISYNVTRGSFGVDAERVPSVCWTGTDGMGKSCFYPLPMPSCKGKDRYPAPSASIPTDCLPWEPYYALTAGPVLVKDGWCVCDLTRSKLSGSYFVSNYEMFHTGIYNVDEHPDRTAVGILEDGRVVLLVCDGRIRTSEGATIEELARIMKGLGCKDAVNLDGGGSTAMVVMGDRVNSLESDIFGSTEDRPVFSTIGFFRRD